MARLSLTPQKREFFDLYSQASANTVEIARLLVELLDRFPDGGKALIGQIKELEHLGDRLTHDIVLLLNKTFVTPFDRDDMYRLAGALDDICDHIDEAVRRLEGFKDSSDQLAELRALEDEGDALERDAVAELFRSTDDAKTIIRWKDIHERLEEAVDALENAADVLEAIVVKNR